MKGGVTESWGVQGVGKARGYSLRGRAIGITGGERVEGVGAIATHVRGVLGCKCTSQPGSTAITRVTYTRAVPPENVSTSIYKVRPKCWLMKV